MLLFPPARVAFPQITLVLLRFPPAVTVLSLFCTHKHVSRLDRIQCYLTRVHLLACLLGQGSSQPPLLNFLVQLLYFSVPEFFLLKKWFLSFC